MTNFPDTRLSLLQRLPAAPGKQVDHHAWEEFSECYAPLIYRFARRRGLQDSDAHELVQRVLLSVARAVDGWQPGAGKPKFRNWLFTIARNHLINIFRAGTRNPSDGAEALHQLPDHNAETGCHEDFRREAFLWAATRIKHQVAETTWQAFWKTAVEGLDCSAASSELGISVGSVYAARSRVLAKVKAEVTLYTSESQVANDEGAAS